jgi:acyl-CoA hydrolase
MNEEDKLKCFKNVAHVMKNRTLQDIKEGEINMSKKSRRIGDTCIQPQRNEQEIAELEKKEETQ